MRPASTFDYGRPVKGAGQPREAIVNREGAENIAIEALCFLAADTPRLKRFLDLSGLEAGSIRTAAGDPHFLVGVLEYVNTDETLLTAFAASVEIDPAAVEQARVALSGQRWERDVP